MVEALSASSLEVVQAEFVLEFALVLFHPPTRFGGGRQFDESHFFLRQMCQPVARGREFTLRPLSCSKCEKMHDLALRVFIQQYNQQPVS